jgi:murein DD-endopeptidase MepM/ murein hydrolase activator NlpD
VRPGSILRVRGKTLSRADQVVFMGAEGALDDIAAAPSVRRKTSVDVRVPFGAARGPVAVVDRDGAVSVPSAAPLAVEATPAGAGPNVEFAVRSPRFFHGSAQPAALTYVVHGAAPVDVTVDLVRAADGVVIGHWDAPQVVPEVPQIVTWNGETAGGVQAEGRYLFRVSTGGVLATLAQAGGVKAPDPAAFEFAHHRFPILGAYKFGSGVAGFGGGRGHQGNDVFAKCGTPLVAAQGGRVEYAGYHGRAGNYLVIDTPDGDHAYMHLRDTALVKTDDVVVTGQSLGVVGDTGSATACHLHFEIWTEPGWYNGGSPVDPLPILKTWR